MTDEMPAIRAMHGAYQDITGILATLTHAKIHMWRCWMVMGWTKEDLKLVVRMLSKRITERPRLIRALRFEYLIGDVERFDGDLSEARALDRAPKPCVARESVLRATGRQCKQVTDDGVKTVAQSIKASEALAALLKLRDSL